MKNWILAAAFVMTPPVFSQETSETFTPVVQKRTYPGGADEESLSVLSRLPEAPLRTSARQVQKEVYKTIYNQELKDESTETMEE